jgi:glutathione S-transferase
MLEEGMDFRNRTVKQAYNRADPSIAGHNATVEWDKALPPYAEALQAHLRKYEAWLGDNEYFAAGYEPTVADFHMYELLDQNKLMVPGCLDAFPQLEAFCGRFASLEKIAAYLASDRCIVFPCNNQHSYTTFNKLC